MDSLFKDLAGTSLQPGMEAIGHLTWGGVGEMLISPDELRQKLNDSGLGEGWMPKPIRLPDAFRRATTVKFRREIQEGTFENYMFREVTSDKRIVQRNLVCETVDTRGKRLNYDGASGTAVLDKKEGCMEISHSTPLAEQLIQNALLRFDIYRNHYGSSALRSVIAAIIKSLSPTPVKQSGGVYFIPQQFEEPLRQYTVFIRSLEKGEVEMIPLIDTQNMKGMVTRRLLEHLRVTFQSCEVGATVSLKKGELKILLEEAKRIVEDVKNYESIVTGDLQEMDNLCQGIRENVATALQNMNTDE